MGFGFLNLLMLFGLFAAFIPPIIHLLSRRRYEVVDWGAMQFLKVSETTRRRLLIEEIILMLLRMGMIAILVLGLAAPYLQNTLFARLAGRPNRDVVLIFDGSYSMTRNSTGKSVQDAAKEWATHFVDDLSAGDSVAILQAKQQVVPVLGEATQDLRNVREKIAHLPEPRGGCDWPQAVQAAYQILARGQRAEREIIILSDNQRFGWADDNSLLHWELLATELRGTEIKPNIRVVNLSPEKGTDADQARTTPNWTLAPIRASRAVASTGQEVTFRTALVLSGQKEYRPPHRLHLEVDGSPVKDLEPPHSADLGDKGQVPLSFNHRFTVPGSHLVSLIVEPDPPAEQRPPGYQIKDQLPGDNRQDFAVEVVPALPVLLVDGDDRPTPKLRGIDFLRDALAPARDLNPVVLARVVSVREFDPALLGTDLGKDAGTKPRVLVLSNVAHLTSAQDHPEDRREQPSGQQEAVTQFLTNGGGVLVTLGDRVDAEHYNKELFRRGQGWLPARLDDSHTGDETDLAHAPRPLASSFFHPALDLFREVTVGGLADARFPRWWRLTAPGKDSPAVPVALLTNNDPFLVERPYPGTLTHTAPGVGRVVLCAVPLDNSWHTNLPDLPAFAPLAHELIYYLAGARSAEHNLEPGQPLRYRLERETAPTGLSLQPPEGEAKPLQPEALGNPSVYPAQLVEQAQGSLLVYEGTRETGIYELHTADNHTVYYVVQPDPRESDLTPCSDSDRDKVASFLPLKYQNEVKEVNASLTASVERQELWNWFLVAMIVFLCAEVWMTRRIARSH